MAALALSSCEFNRTRSSHLPSWRYCDSGCVQEKADAARAAGGTAGLQALTESLCATPATHTTQRFPEPVATHTPQATPATTVTAPAPAAEFSARMHGGKDTPEATPEATSAAAAAAKDAAAVATSDTYMHADDDNAIDTHMHDTDSIADGSAPQESPSCMEMDALTYSAEPAAAAAVQAVSGADAVRVQHAATQHAEEVVSGAAASDPQRTNEDNAVDDVNLTTCMRGGGEEDSSGPEDDSMQDRATVWFTLYCLSLLSSLCTALTLCTILLG